MTEGKRGDEIVEIKMVTPKVSDERSKEILRELAKLNPEDPREELWKQDSEQWASERNQADGKMLVLENGSGSGCVI